MSTPFSVEHASWDVDLDALRLVRETVFVSEQQVSREEEWDALDAVSDHVLARDVEGRPIGTGRLTPEGKIGRMAVLAPWRGRGVGAAMLRTLIERARERGWTQVELHAQVSAIDFYARMGFEAYGEEFMEANIRHRHMRLALEPLQPTPTQRGVATVDPEPQTLITHDSAEVRAALLQLLNHARHAFCVHSRDLDPGVLDDPEVIAAMRRLASSGRGASLRILLHDPAAAMRDGHLLIPLVQRLPSIVQMHVPVEEDDRAYPSTFVLNDTGGYLLRPLAGRFEGRGSSCDRTAHLPLQRYFDAVWERSRNATELRPIGI
jgi:predicted GNAT family N-acyltransferase